MQVFIGVLVILISGLSHHLAFCWKRSALVYHMQRNQDEWKRHLMRIDESGAYTGQWHFDAVILTTEFINGKEIYTASNLTASDYTDLLDDLFQDAKALNDAFCSLLMQHGQNRPSQTPLQISIAAPYFNPHNPNRLNIDGKSYKLSNANDRLIVAKWYMDQIKRRVNSNSTTWAYFNFGLYYHLEEVLDRNGDVEYLEKYNAYGRSIGLETVWVPFYDTEYAWKGKELGFDYVVVQPRYSFLSSIDGGQLKGDRLYSSGKKASALKQCYEYELRSQGESKLETWIAHQYLAIAQYTGAWLYPQVFFVGGPDIFDRLESKASGLGYMWDAYTDLANYLRGDTIANMEVALPWPSDVNSNLKELTWRVDSKFIENMSSVRLDFNDYDPRNIWRGRLSVKINGDNTKTSFAVRTGTDDINPEYNSVFVPFSNEATPLNTILTISLTKESDSPWPNILLFVAAKYEPQYISTPIFNEVSLSSRPAVVNSGHVDNSKPQLGFVQGKLTDGKISPTGVWWWDGTVGWNLNENKFTVTIDLGSIIWVTGIEIVTYKDFNAGVSWPSYLSAFASEDCQPQERGKLDACVPKGLTGDVTLLSELRPGTTCYNATMSASFGLRGLSARYVTVTANCRGWCLLDEIEVVNENEVVSTSKKYRVTPTPGSYSSQPPYADNSQLLVDGAIFSDWIFGNKNSDGIRSEEGKDGVVEATFDQPRIKAKWAVIWITNAKPSWGISLPATVKMQWRNQNMQWQSLVEVPTSSSSCGPSPCAKLSLPSGSKVTGVRGLFPTSSWTFVTEVSLI